MTVLPRLGLGVGWRKELAPLVLRRPDLGFVEVLAEQVPVDGPLPLALVEARRRGLAVVPHGLGLSLGGADPPEPARLDRLARLAERLDAPLVSEHVAFVRAGGVEAGHLLPVARTRASLEVLVENVGWAVERLAVPLALEPIATLFEWPGPEMGEAEFLTELLERTGAWLLLDVANVHANAANLGFEPLALLRALPLHRLAYVHVAGGVERDGIYYDSHRHPVPHEVIGLLGEVAAMAGPLPAALLERDGDYPMLAETDAELDAIAGAARLGEPARSRTVTPRPRLCGATAAQRAEVAVGQAALVAAVLDGGRVPEGFDADRLAAASAVLAAKRRPPGPARGEMGRHGAKGRRRGRGRIGGHAAQGHPGVRGTGSDRA